MNKNFDAEFLFDLLSRLDRINQPRKLIILFFMGLIGNTLSWFYGIIAPEKLYHFMNSFKPPFETLIFYYFPAFSIQSLKQTRR